MCMYVNYNNDHLDPVPLLGTVNNTRVMQPICGRVKS